jgi:hypothetical protein
VVHAEPIWEAVETVQGDSSVRPDEIELEIRALSRIWEYNDRQQLKSELEIVHCGSEQLMNCED